MNTTNLSWLCIIGQLSSEVKGYLTLPPMLNRLG